MAMLQLDNSNNQTPEQTKLDKPFLKDLTGYQAI